MRLQQADGLRSRCSRYELGVLTKVFFFFKFCLVFSILKKQLKLKFLLGPKFSIDDSTTSEPQTEPVRARTCLRTWETLHSTPSQASTLTPNVTISPKPPAGIIGAAEGCPPQRGCVLLSLEAHGSWLSTSRQEGSKS